MKTRENFREAKTLICPMCGMICKTESSEHRQYITCPDCQLEYEIALVRWEVSE